MYVTAEATGVVVQDSASSDVTCNWRENHLGRS